MAGSEVGIIEWNAERVAMGDSVKLPDGQMAPVVEIYDDEEHGRRVASRPRWWSTTGRSS